MRRVVVTGLGAVTPLGNTAPDTWRAALAGESGIDWIRAFDAGEYPVRVAAEVKDFDPTGVASPKEQRKLDRNVLMALAAGKEAVESAGLNGFDPHRVGIAFGSAIGGIAGIMQQGEVLRERGYERISPSFIPSVLVDAASGQLAITLGIRGPNYAEVLAYGTSNDGHHMAQPEPEAIGVGEMMRAAIDRAGLKPEDVGYINAHGTSTPLGDAAETKAIKDVFGDHAYELAVSSTKSVTGHCFGAAGAIEAMMCVLAVHHGVLPPTINYEHPDPDCDLDYVPNEARQARVDVALSNAMGRGGHNGCVLGGRVD